MDDIKDELKLVVQEKMLPEVELYIEDLHVLIEEGRATEDDMNIIKEMESFMVELQNIIEAIETDKMDDEQAEEVYENIMKLIEESEGH